jgi:hypothetical protein
MAQPTEEHLQSALRILRYVSGTKDRGLLYRAGTTVQLAGYTDHDGNPSFGDHDGSPSKEKLRLAWVSNGMIVYADKHHPHIVFNFTIRLSNNSAYV